MIIQHYMCITTHQSFTKMYLQLVKNAVGPSVFMKLCPYTCKNYTQTHTESFQNLLIRHFGLLPLAVSVPVHCVGRVFRLDLRFWRSQHFFHRGRRLWWVHDGARVDLRGGKRVRRAEGTTVASQNRFNSRAVWTHRFGVLWPRRDDWRQFVVIVLLFLLLLLFFFFLVLLFWHRWSDRGLWRWCFGSLRGKSVSEHRWAM